MWLLTHVTSGNVLIVIREKSKYTIGRVGADLVITDDSSISRTHAFLHITTNQTNETDSSRVNELIELEDAGSKYGTFHNDGINKNSAIAKQTKITLADGDRIRFGVLKSIWKVTNIAPLVATSVLPTEHAQQLKQYMDVLGGCILQGGWNEKYTHLTLGEINMTSKLLHALLDQKPIVTCDYWLNVVQAARRGRRTMPQVAAYMPPNPNNIDLKYHAERQQLFKGLTFVFLHAHHYKTYASIVEKAGGESKHLNQGIQKSFMGRKDVVVIQYVPSTESQSSQTLNTIEDCLKRQSRRTVPEYEIGLAIIQCSTEKFCNPSYNPDDNFELLQTNATESCKQTSAILTNSSSPLLNGDETEVFIPETDRKSTASTNLTDKPNSNQTNDSIESRVEQTDTTTGSLEPKENNTDDVTMSSLKVTESLQRANKRKLISKPVAIPDSLDSHMDSEEDDIFNFAAKKANIDDKPKTIIQNETVERRKSPESNLEERPTTSAAAAKQTPKSCQKQLPIEISKRANKNTVINMSGFLEKSQAPIPSRDDDVVDKNDSNAAAKQGTKRARVADIDNSDDDDLFCFGDDGGKKDDDAHNAKRARTLGSDGNDSDEDLFNFGGDADDDNGEDVIDAEARQPNRAPPANQRKQIVMPKPKPLPAKICITTWLDCSLSTLHIKAEEMKKEETDLEKKENNDSGVEGVDDSKDIIEPVKGGCVVTMLSAKSLLHEREVTRNESSMQTHAEQNNNQLNGGIQNFKKFSKKFQPQNRRVIRTVSSTVCGSLV